MADELTSPPCAAASADDAYMGYLGHDELLAALNELLEAERAGTKVAVKSLHAAGDDGYSRLIHRIRDDEARWCNMLSAAIRRLGGSPSPATGAFLEKSMAIVDPYERLSFLIRGQGWVVRKLTALRPKVRDDRLHRELGEMLDNHKLNIGRVGELLAGNSSGTVENDAAAAHGGDRHAEHENPLRDARPSLPGRPGGGRAGADR